jgi:Dipeptidyl aminopeptidases/acylaminoacyl-peptidases
MSLESFSIDGSCGVIRGEAYRPNSPRGTVVICHGFKGFSHWGFFPYLAEKLENASLTAITFDFSGSGVGADRNSFTELDAFCGNTFSKELDDLDRVIEHARAKQWIDGGFGLFGHSRGGAIAILHAGSDPDVSALVTWAAVSNVNRWPEEITAPWRARGYTEIENSRTHQILKIGTELLDDIRDFHDSKLDVAAAASRIRAPWLILHGASDETVPAAEAERLHSAAPNSRLEIVPGNHGFDVRHPMTEEPAALRAVTSETVSFFLKHLSDK